MKSPPSPRRPGFATPPTQREEEERDLSNYSALGGIVESDILLERLLEQMPPLAPVIGKGIPFDQRVAAMKELDKRYYESLVGFLISLSFLVSKVGQFQDALDYALLKLETIRTVPEDTADSFLGNSQPRNMADAYQRVGSCYIDMGELSLALQAYLQAETFLDKDDALRKQLGIKAQSEYDRLFLGVHPRSSLYHAMAGLYRRLGDDRLASEYSDKAWKYSEDKRTEEAQFERVLAQGAYAYNHGDFERALRYYRDALDLALRLDQSKFTSKDVVEACSALGDVYSALNLSRKAMEYYQRALDLNKGMNNHGRIIVDLGNIGDLHRKMGRETEAMKSYQEAIGYASVRVKGLWGKSKTSAGGLPVFKTAGGTYQIVRADPAWKFFHKMGQIESKHNLSAAAEHFDMAIRLTEMLRTGVIEEENRIAYQESIIEVYESMIELQYARYQATGTRDCLESMFMAIERAKSRVLMEQLADLPVLRPDNVSLELLDQEERLAGELEQLERQLMAGQGDPTVLAGKLSNVRIALNQTWSKMAAENPREGAQYVSLRRAEPITPQLARHYISQGGKRVCAVEYYLTREHLFAMLLFTDTDEIQCISRKISRDTIHELTLVNPKSPPSLDLRLPYWQLDLAPLLIEPIAPFLKEIDFLIFVPHDVLHSIPLHALYMSQQEKRSCIQIPDLSLTYIPSLSLMKYVRSKPARNHQNNLVMGNPLREDQPSIEHTQQEAVSVAEILNAKPYLGQNATRQTFAERAGLAEYIHLACHGQFSRENALASALLLTGGDLQVRDIFNVHLAAELVVLSACETGINQNRSGDELIGFVRSLLYAGAPSVILSLWNAYDKSTAQLMTTFYGYIIHQKMPKAKALAQVQRELIEMGIAEGQWAPFILIGDWE
jgi:tetratricopeptide (TPR) repeat protein